MQEKTHKNVAVFAFPFATHAAPLLSLIRRISSVAGPNVSFTFFSTAKSNDSLFTQNGEFGEIKPYNVWDGLPEGFDPVKSDPHEPVIHFLKVVPGNFKAALVENGTRFSCVVTDAFYWWGADVAEEMRVPWVPLWTAGPRALLVHVDVENIRQKVGPHEPQDKTMDFLPGFSAIRTMDMPEGVITEDLKSPISSMLNKLGTYLPRAAAVPTNSFEELDPHVVQILKSRFRFINIGPFALTTSSSPTASSTPSDQHGCLTWLDTQGPASVAYISFGSVITPPPHELAALAAALAETKVPFLWSFRGNPEKHFDKDFLSSSAGKFVPWAPQVKVLEHKSVGVFVTHCGWNSVLESIIGGVPMICRPFFGDQPLNVRTVEADWGVGLGIEGGRFTKDGTKKALESIISSDQGKIMRKKLVGFREQALNAVKKGGSSSENFKILVDIVTK